MKSLSYARDRLLANVAAYTLTATKALARVVVTLLILATGCAGAYELWDYYMLSPWARDAKVRADVVTIAPDVAGFVYDIRVKDNQFVRKGDILFILDQDR